MSYATTITNTQTLVSKLILGQPTHRRFWPMKPVTNRFGPARQPNSFGRTEVMNLAEHGRSTAGRWKTSAFSPTTCSRNQHFGGIDKVQIFLAFGVQLIGGLPSQGPKQSTTTWVNSPISLLKCLNTTMTLAPPEPNQQQWLSSVSLPPSLHLPLSRVDLSLSLPLSLSPSLPLSLSLSLTHSLTHSLSLSFPVFPPCDSCDIRNNDHNNQAYTIMQRHSAHI